MNLLKQIDYSLYTDKERVGLVNELLKDNPVELSTGRIIEDDSSLNKQIEGLANYILYGKDEKKLTNQVQQKKILQPKRKYNTYARKEDESLESLMESPTFEEVNVRDYGEKNVYVKPKQTIRRPKKDKDGNIIDIGDGDVPGMMELWESIDDLAHQLDVYNRKVEPEDEVEAEILQWDAVRAYKIKHWLIDLRKHQYFLKDGHKPPIPSHCSFPQPSHIDWESNSGYWKGVTPGMFCGDIFETHKDEVEEDKYYWYLTFRDQQYRKSKIDGGVEFWYVVREHIIDLTNPDHIYCLFELYDELKKSSWDDLNGQMKYILMTLDDLQDYCDFTEVQEHILDRKVLKYTNERIKKELHDIFGIDYNVNYISTIYKKNICGRIAKIAELKAKEHKYRNNPEKWKRCSCCGKLLLRDPYNFVKKTGTKDNFAARCKKCDKLNRDKKKGE